MSFINMRRSTEHQRFVVELRRSSAANKHRNKKIYQRRDKSWRTTTC